MRVSRLTIVGGGIAVWLCLVAWIVVLLPLAGIGTSTTLFVLCAVTGVLVTGCGVWMLARSARERRLSAGVWWPALIAPVFGTVDTIRVGAGFGGTPAFAMRGDAAWNTAQAAFIHREGGVDAATHPNPAPLMNTLMALAQGPGADPSMVSVLRGNWIVLVSVACVASLLGGLVVARSSVGAAALVRAALCFAAGWLPFSGIFLGAAFVMGHFNSLIALVLLWCTWIVARDLRTPTAMRFALLTVCCTAIAATWAPLVVVPVALLVGCVASAIRDRRGAAAMTALRPAHVAVALFGIAQVGCYGLFVSLPDLRRSGQALGADGAALGISMDGALAILAVSVAAGVLLWGRTSEAREARGDLTVVGVLGAVMVATILVLVHQRSGTADPWGYYPIKFFLLGSALGVGVLVSVSGRIAARTRGFGRQIVIGVVVACPFFVLTLLPFAYQPQFALWPAEFSRRLAQPGDQQAVEDLVRVADAQTGDGALFLHWNQTPAQDAAVNSYLIQLAVQTSDDPLRDFAYSYDYEGDGPLCDLLAQWGRPVDIYTRTEYRDSLSAVVATCAPNEAVRILTDAP